LQQGLIYSESLPEGGSLVTAALSPRDGAADAAWRDQVQAFGVDRLRGAAGSNKVQMAVGQELGDLAGPEWAAEVQANARRVKALLGCAGEVMAALDTLGIPGALFESGGVFAASALPTGAFGSGDVDLLVSPDHWEAAMGCLAELGFGGAGRRSEGIHRCEMHLVRGEHTLYLDVAPVPFERMDVPLPCVDRTKVWLARRVPSPRDGRIYTLRPEDLLVQVAVHTSLHQYLLSPGLRLHVDVERLVRDVALDWDEVVREIAAVGLRTRAFVSLAMAAGLLGAAIPPEVLMALAPNERRWRSLAGLIASEGVVVAGGAEQAGSKGVRWPRLSARTTLKLDRLLDDRGAAAWFSGLALPPAAWLRPRLERDGPVPGPDWMLHAHRAGRIVRRLLNRG